MKRLIEICCCSVDDAITAARNGADRIELNTSIECGGLTPSIGMLETVKAHVSTPVIAMIRPRTGGFCYTSFEFESMKRDAQRLLDCGADGIAVGILNEDGTFDLERMKEMVNIAKGQGREVVCHRAFDVSADLAVSAQQMIDLGVTRILTSGGCARCLEGGLEQINALYHQFGDQIEWLACGSIRPNNLAEILAQTDVRQFHMAPMMTVADQSMNGKTIRFNGTPEESSYRTIDPEMVQAACKIAAQG